MRWDHLRQKNWNHTIYISFLRSLFLMLMIPLVMLFAAYIGLNAKLREQTCERILETLKNGTQKMEMTFDSLDQIGYYLNENSDIIQYFSADEESIMGHTTDVLRAQKVLSSIHISNLDILNIQIYSGQSDTLIDYFTNALYLERYYDNCFRLKDMDFALFRERLLEEEINYLPGIMTVQKFMYDVLVYNCRPGDIGRQSGNRILFYISQDRLLQLVSSVEYGKDGFLGLMGEDGSYLLYDNRKEYDLDGIDWSALTGESGYREMKFGGRRMLLAWYRSDTRNWLCVEAIPVSDVLAVTKGFRILMLCLLCFGIIVGAALVILTAGRLSAPIIEIGRALGKNDGKIPMEDFVVEVRNLVAYNAELDEKMQLQTSVLKTGAFYRLLTGELLDEKSVEEVLDKIGIPRQASHYVILLVSCNDIGVETRLDEISAQKVFLEKIIREQRYEEIVEIYHIDFERMVILLASRHLSVREIRDRAERLVCEVMELIEKSVFFSVSVGGDIIDNISKLPKAFVHTQKALNIPQNVFGSRKIQWYERVRQYQAMERYELNSREDSVSLQNLVLMDKAKKYIHENFSDPQLSLSMVGEELCITEVYLSKLFKKVTGENFSKYVENCRMEKAKEWMDQGRKVKEVAELTGYNSPQVFRRAWKRYYDHAPSENRSGKDENV